MPLICSESIPRQGPCVHTSPKLLVHSRCSTDKSPFTAGADAFRAWSGHWEVAWFRSLGVGSGPSLVTVVGNFLVGDLLEEDRSGSLLLRAGGRL